MGTNIKTLQDALFVLDSMIRKEANRAGVLTSAQASQIGFIQAMLIKFPLRNCDRFATAADAMDEFHKIGCPNDCGDCPFEECAAEGNSEYCEANWLFAPAAQEGGDHADA